MALVTVGAFAGRFPGRAAADHAAAGGLPRLNMTKQKKHTYIIIYYRIFIIDDFVFRLKGRELVDFW